MRPMVQCDSTIMTLTASGQGYSHLFVDRGGDSPISVFHLPPNCGYSVSTSWNDLVVAVPYDGCYMTQEKTPSSPAVTLSALRALCSPYGVVLHMYGTEEDVPTLGTIVTNDWAPLVSAKCALRTKARPGNLLFYVPLTAPCLVAEDGPHLKVLKGDQEFSVSCSDRSTPLPDFPIPPSTPVQLPVDRQYPHPPDPVTPAPASTTPSPAPPQSPTQAQVVLPDLLNYPHPGFQYPQFYPPEPQAKRPSQPSPDRAPGPQPQFSTLFSAPGQQHLSPHQPQSPPPQPAVEPTSGSNVDPVNQNPKWPPQVPPVNQRGTSNLYSSNLYSSNLYSSNLNSSNLHDCDVIHIEATRPAFPDAPQAAVSPREDDCVLALSSPGLHPGQRSV
ncbi:hypothetical protein NHX12_018678 [Muraenolepis orangiensis]|uniref:Uncharacterized protein n=1 Tax=Muraenolepis orangiensis TaxID=630683 RepID=A0A9Q0EZI2_9TELE|nr:hypothetical protein NHX12_018678 [Muraenolepis orangiensis]